MTDGLVPEKDPDRAHPIPAVWRPVLRDVVHAFARGDFRLARGVTGADPIAAPTAAQVEAYLNAYGESLDQLPDATWDSSMAQWMGDCWEILVDLWTVESGRSDLVLSARVYERGAGFRIAVDAVYVP